MQIFMFVRCSNDASLPLEIELEKETDFMCPFHVENSEYCDFKGQCRFVGKFYAIPWVEDGKYSTPLTFSGKRIRGDKEEKWTCPSVRQDDFMKNLIETVQPETIVLIEGGE